MVTVMSSIDNHEKFTTIRLLQDAATKDQHTVLIISSLFYPNRKIQSNIQSNEIQENEINMADPQLLPKILQQIVSWQHKY